MTHDKRKVTWSNLTENRIILSGNHSFFLMKDEKLCRPSLPPYLIFKVAKISQKL